MRAVDIIRRKRDGETLWKEEISFLVNSYLKGDVPDYQMSAFLMAVYHRGMNETETVALTEAMLATGKKLDLSPVAGTKIDKHSTGGVGDKVSIILAPIMAAMGLKVPMLAGRGLGHTGGTLDKLSSIPGMRVDLRAGEIIGNLKTVGFVITGQTPEMAPADRRLYALRDATATVESIPLIAASIMSKKLSEGIEALLLDVKAGSGAFMKDLESARQLARLLVKIGNSAGVKTVALVTDMDTPLGRTVGNSLEIKECITALKGTMPPKLGELTLTLSSWMLYIADSVTEETGLRRLGDHMLKKFSDEVRDYIEHGDAFKKFVEFVDAQHGNPEVAFNLSLLPKAAHVKPVLSPWTGYIRKLDAHAAGHAASLLGAGRSRMEEDIDPAAGIVMGKKPGDPIAAGEPLATLHTNSPETLKEAEEAYLSGIKIGDREPAKKKLVLDVILE